MPAADLAGVIRDSGLVSEGDSGVVMVSGGADSVALLTGLAEVLPASRLLALHVNYGRRPEADADEQLVRDLCGRLGIELAAVAAGTPEGNFQSWARQVRHREAERLRADRGMDWIAVGHNRSDLAETFIYRLASSPGSRSLLAMPPRSGHVIRPLLALDRTAIRALLGDSFRWVEDSSNLDPSYARNRIRLEVIPSLEQINPAAGLNIARTREELEEDEGLIGDLAAEALQVNPDRVPKELLDRHHPAVQRRMLRQLAERELGEPVSVSRAITASVLRLAASPEGGEVEFSGGCYLIEAGTVRVSSAGVEAPALPDPVEVSSRPGTTRFGQWDLRFDLIGPGEARSEFGAERSAFLDADDLPGGKVLIRTWRAGDRIDQLGMEGSRLLQDVFTDPASPRTSRRSWPVVVAAGKVLWVPGLAVSRHFLVAGHTKRVLRVHARPPFSI